MPLPFRVDPSQRAVLAMGACVALVAVVTLAWVISARPRAASVAALGASAVAVPRSSTSASSTAATIVVDVAGSVRRPGVYTLPLGARVIDAVRQAGGALHGVSLAQVNLAARLVDGQQVVVGSSPGVMPAGGASAGGAASGPVSLNSATLEQLDALPGVGPVLAQNILDYRQAHGRFASVDQLNEVPGIGPAKFAMLRNLVTP